MFSTTTLPGGSHPLYKAFAVGLTTICVNVRQVAMGYLYGALSNTTGSDLRKNLVLAAAAVFVSGCSSIVSESNYPVSIQSSPAGANYEITNEAGMLVSSGVTPGQVTLKAGAGFFDGEMYRISYKKDGYQDQVTVVDSELDGWYWGNIVFGGLIGMLIVDPATGAMYKLPKSAHGNLVQLPPPVATAPSK